MHLSPPYQLAITFVIFTITLFFNVAAASAYKYPDNYARDYDSPRISKKLIRQCPVADGFDFPVGKPNAKGYYNAQKFTRNNHLADDWNGVGGGNSDLGDAIYAVANGIVVQTKNYGGPWGRVTRILHNAGTAEKPVYVESLYAHMRSILVKRGMIVKRGQKIGTIGNANGTWWAHLHLEIRTTINKSIGVGYSRDTTGYADPTRYIKRHRPVWRYAARKRRLAQIQRTRKLLAAKRKALKKRRLRTLAKRKGERASAATIAALLEIVEISLAYLTSNKAAKEPTKELAQAETVASNIWSGSMYAVSIAEETSESTENLKQNPAFQTFWYQFEPNHLSLPWPNKNSDSFWFMP